MSSALAESLRKALANTRIEKDRMEIQLNAATDRAGRLEQENEALREFVAYLAKGVLR